MSALRSSQPDPETRVDQRGPTERSSELVPIIKIRTYILDKPNSDNERD